MNPVETALLQNIDKPNSCFVFPTDIAASRWADHLLRLKGGTIAINKFIAWDIFKQNSIKSKVQNKKSIPSALRKIFVSCLIRENAENCEKGKGAVFHSLIQAKWAGQAYQFTAWLTGILPQLGVWFKKTTGLSIDCIRDSNAEEKAAGFEGDDRDMFVLARRYALFLDKHGLFEPAWETPPFNDDGTEYFIFFPRSLSDYSEYRQLLEASEHVKIINAAETDNSPCDSFFYANSRREITEAALYIRALHEKNGINWDSIAVCVPDSQDYEPYLMREFKNRNIPFVKRISKPLSDYPAGRFFRCALDCVSQNFSFSSLVSLLINRNLPWKNISQIDKLINFGIENNCLYSWIEKINGKDRHIDVWEDSFLKPVYEAGYETKKYFEHLKHRLQSMHSASSFSELRRQYFSFRAQFFDMEKCSDETDIILSRCIAELLKLVEIEKEFIKEDSEKEKIDFFSFFVNYLGEIFYLARPKTSGAALLPYKAAAAAPFDCHIILGAGQESLSVVYSHLNFLPQKKRKELGISEEDASADFITLHKFNSVKISAFFCSEQTFSGYTIPHSKVNFPSEPEISYASDSKLKEKFAADHYAGESALFSVCASDNPAPLKLHENQLNGFTEWKDRRYKNLSLNKKWNMAEKTQELVRSYYEKNGKYSVSASSLKSYFQCSLKWLFERVLTIENVQIETSLMQENISGLIYHAVLNKFFTELKNNGEILLEPVYSEFDITLPSVYYSLLERSIDGVFNDFPLIKSERNTRMSVLTSRLMNAGKKDFQFHLEKCLAHFLSFFAGCRVTESEISYQSEKDNFLLNGTIDCVLKDVSEGGDGKYIIIDFKLKNMPSRAECTGDEKNAVSDFQLPMYITLAEENENIKIYTALFYSILDSNPEVIIGAIKDKNTEKTIPKNEDDRITYDGERYNSIFDEFNKKTKQFAQEVSTGNFTVFNSQNNNCSDCRCQRICRTAYVIDRENTKTLAAN